MKNKALIALIAVTLAFAGAASAAPSRNDNWQVIKKAVREDARPAAVRGESKWFKIHILDKSEKGGELKITLPLSLIEGLAELASGEHFKCNGREMDLDFAGILQALKKAGPLALIEIKDDGGLIKIWIE